MVTFTGHITGDAERLFMRKAWKRLLVLLCPPGLVTVLFSYMVSIVLRDLIWFKVFSSGFFMIAFIFILGHIVKRSRLAMLPQLIYTEEGKITCVSERYTEVGYISNVSKVVDHGTFYELCFQPEHMSEKFICQKDLLTRGSLKEFEEIFEGKIEKWVSK